MKHEFPALLRRPEGGWAYLWTLTTPDQVDLKELSQRWQKLIWNGFTPCVRVFEKHPRGHGYHVHFVTAERIDVGELRLKAEAVVRFRLSALIGMSDSFILPEMR